MLEKDESSMKPSSFNYYISILQDVLCTEIRVSNRPISIKI